MTTPRLAIIPSGWRHIAHAAVFAGAIALGTGVFGPAAVANAEWDIGKYDTCTDAADKRWLSGEISSDELTALYMVCCVDFGGVLSKDLRCTAPLSTPNHKVGQPRFRRR